MKNYKNPTIEFVKTGEASILTLSTVSLSTDDAIKFDWDTIA